MADVVSLSPGVGQIVTIVIEVDCDYDATYRLAPGVVQMMELAIRCPSSKITITSKKRD